MTDIITYFITGFFYLFSVAAVVVFICMLLLSVWELYNSVTIKKDYHSEVNTLREKATHILGYIAVCVTLIALISCFGWYLTAKMHV